MDVCRVNTEVRQVGFHPLEQKSNYPKVCAWSSDKVKSGSGNTTRKLRTQDLPFKAACFVKKRAELVMTRRSIVVLRSFL
jgi:hypothetical protein